MKKTEGYPLEEIYKIVALSSTTDIEKSIPCRKWKNRMPEKLYQYYMLKKLPMKQEEVFCMGVPGLRVFLPFTLEDLEQNIDFVYQFLNIWKKRMQIEQIILEPELQKKLEPGGNHHAWLIRYVLFPQIFHMITNRYVVNCKEMKLVLLDSGDTRTDFLLEVLLPYLNYLTIVTPRSKYFEGLRESAYEETGLMVEILTLPLQEPIQGTFILCAGDADTWKGIKNRITKLEEKTVFLFLDGDLESVRRFGQARSDLIYIYDVEVCVGNENIDMAFATAILEEVDWKVKWFTEHRGSFHYVGEAENLLKRYEISLEKLCVFEP